MESVEAEIQPLILYRVNNWRLPCSTDGRKVLKYFPVYTLLFKYKFKLEGEGACKV